LVARIKDKTIFILEKIFHIEPCSSSSPSVAWTERLHELYFKKMKLFHNLKSVVYIAKIHKNPTSFVLKNGIAIFSCLGL